MRRYGAGGVDKPLLIMVHGSGWHGMQFHGLAKELATQADVVLQDLRRHGVSPHRRGDIDYINQFEDDLADLIKATAQPNQKVVVLGHSSSGGLVVRFAGGEHGEIIDHAVLLAPFLKHNAPTTRKKFSKMGTCTSATPDWAVDLEYFPHNSHELFWFDPIQHATAGFRRTFG